jgi:hypothetical protein
MTVGDLFGYFLPAYSYEASRLAERSVPFWNPYQGTGVPFLAVLQPGALYPGRLLLLLVPPEVAMGWSLLGHVLLCVLGTYALCRRLGASRAGAALGAMAFGTAFALPMIYTPSQLESGAWLPLAAFALVSIVAGGGWGWVLLLGVAAGMPALAGGYSTTAYVGYGLVVVTVALVVDRRWRSRVFRPRVLGRLCVAGALAMATAAPQLLPTLAWSAEAVRRTKPLTDLQLLPIFTAEARWQNFVAMFFRLHPAQFGHLSVPVTILAVVGLLAGRGLGLVFGLAAIGAGLLVYAGGADSIWLSIYRALPGLGMFRLPVRLLFLITFFAALCAALGLTSVARAGPLRTSRWRVLLEAAALCWVVSVLVWPYRNGFLLPWTAAPVSEVMDPPLFRELAALARGGRIWLPSDRLDLSQGNYIRQSTRRGAFVLQDYEPLSSLRLGAFLSATAGQPPPTEDAFPPFTGAVGGKALARPELLDLVSVRVVLAPKSLVPPTGVPGWRLIKTRYDLGTYLNDRALPRGYVIGRARFAGDESAALASIVARDFDGHAEVVLEGSPSDGEEAALASAPAEPFVEKPLATDEPEHVVVDVDAVRPGILVLADAFAPGWSVTVDGVPRRLWRANYLVRAVMLRPGDHRVEFRYRAPGFVLGVAVALAVWSCVLVPLAVVRLRRR